MNSARLRRQWKQIVRRGYRQEVAFARPVDEALGATAAGLFTLDRDHVAMALRRIVRKRIAARPAARYPDGDMPACGERRQIGAGGIAQLVAENASRDFVGVRNAQWCRLRRRGGDHGDRIQARLVFSNAPATRPSVRQSSAFGMTPSNARSVAMGVAPCVPIAWPAAQRIL